MKTKVLILSSSIIYLIIATFSVPVLAQNASLQQNDTLPESMMKVNDDTLGLDKEFSSMEKELELLDSDGKKSDTTKIRIGKMKIEFVDDGDDIIINKDSDWNDEDFDEDWTWKNDDNWTFHKRKKHDRFEPHWASLAIGLNNYITPDGTTALPAEWQLLEVNTNNSMEVNINFAQVGLNIIKNHVGLVSGVGIKWNNYKFRNNNALLSTETGALTVGLKPELDGKMSKLNTVYLVVPLLLEFQIPSGGDDFYLSAGVEGGLKLSAHTKIKTNNKSKLKDKSDFYTTSLDYRLTARLGYGDFGIYAAYSMMPLFEKEKGPELYPVAAGVSLNF